MNTSYLHDQRGAAMLLELVLVVAVLGLVGVALYQSSHKAAPTASTTKNQPAANGTVSLANSAAALSTADSNAEADLSATAEASADATADSDVDVTNLGGSTSANAY